mmetsp:Transcript_51670/g.59063  ORF Transcript_51670/g.59063 Transcript_51670/m.59063 type:complete len:111 (+) Transcript_51670:69-401(+)
MRLSRGSKYVLIVLLVSALYSCGVEAKNQKKKNKNLDKLWQAREDHCVIHECSHFDNAVNENCKLYCISPECYKEFYTQAPLEDGEVDKKRYDKYLSCIRKEYKAAKNRK